MARDAGGMLAQHIARLRNHEGTQTPMTAILFGCLLFSGLNIVDELNKSARDKGRARARAARAPVLVATGPGLNERWRDADRRAS